ncbi:MAG: single-stranded-DNA-specific exonuclease RecJ [Patescibacteria group bacterium]
MSKNWQVIPKVTKDFIDKFPEINNVVLQLLANRGLSSQEDVDNFLFPNYEEQALDPFLFKDMPKAVERVLLAWQKKQKVMIFGDYDADGVCSTVLLFLTLKALGLEVETYIPFREGEGYGLNTKVVQQFIEQGYELLITVDCGVSNKNEIEILNDGKVDVIILDHHEEPIELPSALAIINPALKTSGYPEIELCGAGVAFKFVQALMKEQERTNSPIKLPTGFDKWLLDLVAVATVGDMVPLIKENRIFVKYGLTVLAKTKNLGLKKLMETINNKTGRYDAEYLGWRVVPRINAAGRIKHASVAFNLLTSSSKEEAAKWVEILENNNTQRQQITEKILEQAVYQIGEVKAEEKILFASGDEWSAGVVGLVAGKICDRHYRPTLVFSREKEGEKIKYVGSGRSIEEFDITAGLKECHEFLARYGGHPQACGLTILGEDNFNNFKQRITALAQKQLAGVDLMSRLIIEAEVKLADINWELADELEKFEPYGEGNRKPLLAAFGLKVERVDTVGQDGKHLRMMVSQDDPQTPIRPDWKKLIGFSFGDWCAKLKVGEEIDIVFELGVNEWNGNRELQLKIIDLKLSEK